MVTEADVQVFLVWCFVLVQNLNIFEHVMGEHYYPLLLVWTFALMLSRCPVSGGISGRQARDQS